MADNKQMSRKEFLQKTGVAAAVVGAMAMNSTNVLAATAEDILNGKVQTTHENSGETGVTDNLKSEGLVYSAVAPANTHAGWVDLSNGNVLKFYNHAKQEWEAYGTFWRGEVAPTDVKQLWMDTLNGDSIRFWDGTDWAFLGTSHIGNTPPKSWKAIWIDTGHNGAIRYCTNPSLAGTDAGWAYTEFVQVSATEPNNHSSIWIDSSQGGIIKYWDGSKWTVAAAGSWMGNTEPPSKAMTWIKNDGRMYYYNTTKNKWMMITTTPAPGDSSDDLPENTMRIDSQGRVEYWRSGAWHLASSIWS